MSGIIQNLLSSNEFNDVLIAEGSSVFSGALQNPLYYNSDNFFRTQNAANQWWQFKLKNIYVSITSYKIKSPNCDGACPYLKSWTLFGSYDNSTFIQLNRITDTNILNGPNFESEFFVEGFQPPFNIFQISNIEAFNSPNTLFIRGFEIFGTIYSSHNSHCSNDKVSVKCSFYFNNISFHIIFFVFILSDEMKVDIPM